MLTINEIASTYSLGLSIGYFDSQNIIDWVDNLIDGSVEPSPSLIDLSLAGSNVQNVSSILKAMHNGEICQRSYEIITGLIARDYRLGNIEAKMVTQFLDNLGHFSKTGHWPDLLENVRSKEDLKKIEKELHVFLAPYEQFVGEWDKKNPTSRSR